MHSCQRCGKRTPVDRGKPGADATMRYLGWIVWAGKTEDGTEAEVLLCRPCSSGDPVKRLPKVVVIEGQEELF